MLKFFKRYILRRPRLKVFLLPVALRTHKLISDIRMWLGHYLLFGRAPQNWDARENSDRTQQEQQWATCILQDALFPNAAMEAKNLLVIVIPEYTAMSGGLYSLFSIANAANLMKNRHSYHVILMTFPNRRNLTYLRQHNFKNNETVFRFSQINRCINADRVYLHIPEYGAADFIDLLDATTIEFLKTRKNLFINILNQNIMYMPTTAALQPLRDLAQGVSQSVAHHAYFGQSFADSYMLPTLLLPAYTDLSEYPAITFEEKEKLIIYSPDDSAFKRPVLEAISSQMPDYELREIRNITFDQFMHLATRCRFSITFGEGFDGYLIQPMQQNGIGFAVYNKEFFPSEKLLNFYNIFSTGDAMVAGIVEKMRVLESNADLYRTTNRAMMDVHEELYSRQDYLNRIERLIHRDFDLYPPQNP